MPTHASTEPQRPPLPAQARPVEAVELDYGTLEKTPLAGEGNYLYRFPLGEGQAVLKIYFGDRSWFEYFRKSVGSVLLTGRTPAMPRARYRNELDCMRTWERHGFRCFGILDHVSVPALPEQGYLVLEYLPGLHFRDYFADESIPLEERLATWRRWLPEWHRRHATAVRHRDPRLIHENGDVKHVMIVEDDFLYFDFEVVFRSRNLRDLVGRELLAYMRSAGKFFGEETYWRMLEELVRHYPDRGLLHAAYEHAYRNRNLFMRAARALDRRFKPKHQKRFSKYRVAADLKKVLDAAEGA